MRSYLCGICGDPIDPLERGVYQRVRGWEIKAGIRASGKHGGSDIRLREQLDEYAHGVCVMNAKAGVVPGQASLV